MLGGGGGGRGGSEALDADNVTTAGGAGACGSGSWGVHDRREQLKGAAIGWHEGKMTGGHSYRGASGGGAFAWPFPA